MPRDVKHEIRMRLIVDQPVAGVLHSLQDKKSQPVDPRRSDTGELIALDFTIRIGAGPKFYGEQVRSEGPQRRFVYVAIGAQAGDGSSAWSRRMKIDIHDIPQALLDAAIAGGRLETTVNGTGKDGTPACGTIRPAGWRVA